MKSVKSNHIVSNFRVSLLSKNTMFGLQEWISGEPRTTSWYWVSQNSKLYFIPMKDFSSKFVFKIPDSSMNEERVSRNMFVNLRNKSLQKLEEVSNEMKFKY